MYEADENGPFPVFLRLFESEHVADSCSSHSLSRHIVVASTSAAPLLVDTSRSTVGSGTREESSCAASCWKRNSSLSCR